MFSEVSNQLVDACYDSLYMRQKEKYACIEKAMLRQWTVAR